MKSFEKGTMIIIVILATTLVCGSSEAKTKSMPPEAFNVTCERDSDCSISRIPQERNHCCSGCGFEALNKMAVASRKKWEKSNCDSSARENCLIYECVIEDFMGVVCEKGQCVLVHAKNKRDIIGQTISEVMQRLRLKIGKDFVIEEPLGIARGIFGKTKQGELVELYIRRGDLPPSGGSKWQLKDFRNKEIIGVAKLKSSVWHIKGEVMLIRAMDAVPLKEY